MDLVPRLLGLALLSALPLLPADFTASIGFPSAPQSQGCTKRRSDNLTAACQASLNGMQGTALVSIWQPDPGVYIVLGSIHATVPGTGTGSVKSSLSATLTEFSGLTQGGVKLTSNCAFADCEPLSITVNGADAGILNGGDTMYIAYQGQPLSITLSALELWAKPGSDYVGLFDVTATAY